MGCWKGGGGGGGLEVISMSYHISGVRPKTITPQNYLLQTKRPGSPGDEDEYGTETPSYPGSSFPLTSGRETNDPGKIRFEVRKYRTSG